MDPTKKKARHPALPPEVLAKIWQSPSQGIPTDVLGSYTGTGIQNEQPVAGLDGELSFL